MIRLIINGDDFGMNQRCSKAIAAAFRRKCITDTTMMANGAYFDGAVALARGQGFANRIGIHFNLTQGKPLTEAIQAFPRFVSGGEFCKDFIRSQTPLSQAEQTAVYLELTAQVQKLRDAGIDITHADSHHYIHNLSTIAPVAARVCRENGIRKIRLQRNLGNAAGDEENNRLWRDRGFVTTDYFGRMSDDENGSFPDHTEIMVHPDFDRNGNLIDRKGYENGYPIGLPLQNQQNNSNVILTCYRDV